MRFMFIGHWIKQSMLLLISMQDCDHINFYKAVNVLILFHMATVATVAISEQ